MTNNNDNSNLKMPSLFLAHGSPMMAIEDSAYTSFLKSLGESLKPKAIVIFSAHFENEITTVSVHDNTYDTIYDFYGFPKEMYQCKYLAKGSSFIGNYVCDRLEENGLNVQKENKRGLDHGSWVLLMKLFPQANVPVVQVSVNPRGDAKLHYEIGKSLRGLGDQGVLVIGSGVTVHNLRTLRWGQDKAEPWAVAFDEFLVENIQSNRLDNLLNWESLAPNARMAVPTPEHFLPLFVALGASASDDISHTKIINRHYEAGTASYLSFNFN
ncbi:hypothetical protein CYY_002337 [Polysphondylium violaceum]|uniref:Extradiol ring-cleavage dioxygenase class III enzyme subunit B domain-containing protein n=1 Tax=Polysphondylium violaceum TaxID=133409 RepID=A0A8J4V0X0_9MYCE|nr:hypothetical protein CYY_002337 [Polysphondylium violaceum]